ncbi:hypothetical protein C6P45_002057, partial [Maudiozyma exigua]
MLDVYALGSNGNYQLGLGHADDIIVPQLSLSLDLPNNITVQKIACGGNHTLLLLSNGDVYGCGSNVKGQISDDSSIEMVPDWIKFDQKNVKDIACGWEFSVLLDKDNNILVRGYGPKGELGLGENVIEATSFKKVMSIPNGFTCKIFTSFQNVTLLLDGIDGNNSIVYGWGSNTKCQLLTPKSKSVWNPTVIYESKSDQIEKVAMGKNFVLLCNDKGSICSATGAIPKTFNLAEWENKKELEVYVFWSSIHIYYQGQIYSYGFGVHGQLFDNDHFYKTVMKDKDTRLISINTGSEHGMLVTKSKVMPEYIIYCWGWGEHGNCGRVKGDQSEDKPIINDYSNLTSKLNDVMHIESNTPPSVFGG